MWPRGPHARQFVTALARTSHGVRRRRVSLGCMTNIERPRRSRKLKGECTIPPAIPDTALPDLIFKRDREAEGAIRDYVEWQAKEDVTHAEPVTTEYVFGRKLEGWDVRTRKSRWWVITSPTNLYSQELFPSL